MSSDVTRRWPGAAVDRAAAALLFTSPPCSWRAPLCSVSLVRVCVSPVPDRCHPGARRCKRRQDRCARHARERGLTNARGAATQRPAAPAAAGRTSKPAGLVRPPERGPGSGSWGHYRGPGFPQGGGGVMSDFILLKSCGPGACAGLPSAWGSGRGSPRARGCVGGRSS